MPRKSPSTKTVQVYRQTHAEANTIRRALVHATGEPHSLARVIAMAVRQMATGMDNLTPPPRPPKR